MVALESTGIYSRDVILFLAERRWRMSASVLLEEHYKGTNLTAPVAPGLKPTVPAGDHCQCDCHECAGGDTSDDQ